MVWNRYKKLSPKYLGYALRGATLIFAGLLVWSILGNGGEKVKGIEACSVNSGELFQSFAGNRKWILLGSEVDKDEQILEVSLTLDESYRDTIYSAKDVTVSYEILNAGKLGNFTPELGDDLSYSAEVGVGNLKPGRYAAQAHVNLDCGKISSPKYEFNVSYPLYVAWTFDWEGYDVKQQYLNDIDELAQKHYDIPLTHFFNPRIYANPGISKERQEYLTSWVIERRNRDGDAVGLHLHMFKDMVKAAGVEPQDEPAWGGIFDGGYDVLVSGYSYGEMMKILAWSKEMFLQEGLGIPAMFRAGGWFADEGTLKSLEDSSFVLDSSGRTKFIFGKNGVEGHWSLQTTTLPYRPNSYDQNSDKSPTLRLWEFPNNGGDSWAFSKDQLLERFQDNFEGTPLTRRQIVTYLSHPEWFDKDKPKMDGLLAEIDKFLYSVDKGPVIYITLDDAYEIWTGAE